MGLIFRLLWGTTKFGVKHVVIPIATTMVIAAIANRLTERMNADGAQAKLEPSAWHAQP